MSWQLLEEQQPELAAFGVERLNGKVAYLATVRRDGSPAVHPMTPIIGLGRLFVFMEPTLAQGPRPATRRTLRDPWRGKRQQRRQR